MALIKNNAKIGSRIASEYASIQMKKPLVIKSVYIYESLIYIK